MPIYQTEFPGLLVIEPLVFEDERGYFFESYNERLLQEHNVDLRFVQDNQSSSSFGVIRGLHYQADPHGQAKLVRTLSGSILDVVVDLRTGSPTYLKCTSIELSAENKKQLFIPAGFAHGFSVLSARAEVLYKCDRFYHKQSESGIRFDDPELAIDWLIPVDKRIISAKDLELPPLAASKGKFTLG
jgi:dTDP-4-dehydrorhamnose 3,5-epimerase